MTSRIVGAGCRTCFTWFSAGEVLFNVFAAAASKMSFRDVRTG